MKNLLRYLLYVVLATVAIASLGVVTFFYVAPVQNAVLKFAASKAGFELDSSELSIRPNSISATGLSVEGPGLSVSAPSVKIEYSLTALLFSRTLSVDNLDIPDFKVVVGSGGEVRASGEDPSPTRGPGGLFQPLPIGLEIVSASTNGEILLPDGGRLSLEMDLRGLIPDHVGEANLNASYRPGADTAEGAIREVGVEGSLAIALAGRNQIQSLNTEGILRIETRPEVSPRPFAYAWEGSAQPGDGSERYLLTLSETSPDGLGAAAPESTPIVDLDLRFSPVIEAVEGSLDFTAPPSLLAIANSRSGLTTEAVSLQSTFVREKGRELNLDGQFEAAVRPSASADLPVPPDPIIAEAAWDLALSNEEVVLETLDAAVRMGGQPLLILELAEDIRMRLDDEALELGEPGEVLAQLEIPELTLDRLNPFISGNRVTPFLDGTAALGLEVNARGDSLVIASSTPLSLTGISIATDEKVLFEDVNLTLGIDAEITRQTLRLNTSDGFLEARGEGIASASGSLVVPFDRSIPATANLQMMLDLDRLGNQPALSEQLEIGSGDLVMGMELSDLDPLAVSGSLLLRNFANSTLPDTPTLGGELRFNATGSSDRSRIEGRVGGKLTTGGTDSTLETSFTVDSTPKTGPAFEIRIGDLFVDIESLATFAESLQKKTPDASTEVRETNASQPPLRGGLLAKLPSDLGLRKLELAKGTFALNDSSVVRTGLTIEDWLSGGTPSITADVQLEGFPFIRTGERAAATLEFRRHSPDESPSYSGALRLDLPPGLLPEPARLDFSAERVEDIERYRADFRFEDRSEPLVSLDATVEPASGAVSGLARILANDATTGPWLAEMVGNLDVQTDLGLTFRADPAFSEIGTEIDLNAILRNLEKLDPSLAAILPELEIAASGDLSLLDQSELRLKAFEALIGPQDAEPWGRATLATQLSIPLDSLDNPLSSLPANRSLVELSNREIPIATFASLFPESLQAQGEVRAGKIGLRRSLNRFSFSSIEPLGLKNLDLSLKGQDFTDGLDLKLVPTLEIPTTGNDAIELGLDLSIADRSGSLGQSQIQTRLAKDAATGETIPGVVRVKAAVDLAALKRQPVLRDPLWNLETGTIALDGNLALGDNDSVNANFQIDGKDLRPMEQLSRIGFVGTTTITHGPELSELSGEFVVRTPETDTDLQVTGTYEPGDPSGTTPPRMDLQTTGQFLDLDTLTGLAAMFSGHPDVGPDPAANPAAADPVPPATNAQPTGPVWPAINADAKVDFKTVRTGTTRFTDVAAELALSPESIAIESAGFAYRDGKGTLEAATIYRDAIYQLKVKGGLTGLDVGALLADLNPRGRANLTGIFDADFTFESNSPGLETLTDAIVGKASLSGRNGRIRALEAKPALKALLTTGSIIGIATAGNNKRPGIVALSATIPLLETIPFDEIRFELERASDLSTTIPEIRIAGPYLFVDGRGEIGAAPLSKIADASLDLSLAPASRDPLNRHLRILGLTSGVRNELGYERWREEDLRITGTVGNPQADQLWDLLGTALGNTLQKGDVDRTYNPNPDDGSPPEDQKKEDPVLDSIFNVLENL